MKIYLEVDIAIDPSDVARLLMFKCSLVLRKKLVTWWTNFLSVSSRKHLLNLTLSLCLSAHTHTRANTHTHTRANTHSHIKTHTYQNTHTHTHVPTHTHTKMNVSSHNDTATQSHSLTHNSHSNSLILASTPMDTNAHTQTHPHGHSHTHAHQTLTTINIRICQSTSFVQPLSGQQPLTF